jgi:hypothetical protein
MPEILKTRGSGIVLRYLARNRLRAGWRRPYLNFRSRRPDRNFWSGRRLNRLRFDRQRAGRRCRSHDFCDRLNSRPRRWRSRFGNLSHRRLHYGLGRSRLHCRFRSRLTDRLRYRGGLAPRRLRRRPGRLPGFGRLALGWRGLRCCLGPGLGLWAGPGIAVNDNLRLGNGSRR